MNLQEIAAIKPEKKTIKLIDQQGDEHAVDIYLKPLSFQLSLRSQNKDDEDGLADVIAERVAFCVCDEKGESIFKKDQIKGTAENSIRSDIAMALMSAVSEFNGFDEKKTEPQTS